MAGTTPLIRRRTPGLLLGLFNNNHVGRDFAGIAGDFSSAQLLSRRAVGSGCRGLRAGSFAFRRPRPDQSDGMAPDGRATRR